MIVLKLSRLIVPPLLCLWCCLPLNAVEIVQDGEAKATIVVPDEPLPVVSFAAEEFQYHIQRATGARIPIAKESEQPTGRAIVFLGACRATAKTGIRTLELPPNGFILKVVGNHLFLAGDDSDGPPAWILHSNRTRVGTLFAVYEFLEKHLQVRWLWPGKLGEVIPHRTDIVVDAWDQTGAPAFVHTRWRDGGLAVAGTEGWSSGEARSRFLSEQGKWLRRNRFAMGVNMDMAHAFTTWWDRYEDSHPEYFNLPTTSIRHVKRNSTNGSSSALCRQWTFLGQTQSGSPTANAGMAGELPAHGCSCGPIGCWTGTTCRSPWRGSWARTSATLPSTA